MRHVVAAMAVVLCCQINGAFPEKLAATDCAEPTSRKALREKTKVKNGVRLKVVLSRKYTAGDPMIAELRLTNVGNRRDVGFIGAKYHVYRDLVLTVTDAEGKEVRLTRFGQGRIGPPKIIPHRFTGADFTPRRTNKRGQT